MGDREIGCEGRRLM